MQLLMRRLEISGWVSVAPPANHYAGFRLPRLPAPAAGWMIHGDTDEAGAGAGGAEAGGQAEHSRKGVRVDYRVFPGADHIFAEHADAVSLAVEDHAGKVIARRQMALAAD